MTNKIIKAVAKTGCADYISKYAYDHIQARVSREFTERKDKGLSDEEIFRQLDDCVFVWYREYLEKALDIRRKGLDKAKELNSKGIPKDIIAKEIQEYLKEMEGD